MPDVPTSPVQRDGKTALVRRRASGQDKQVKLAEKVYNFREVNGVSLAWVDDSDVPAVLSVRTAPCCGGRTFPEFTFANSSQVVYWTLLTGG